MYACSQATRCELIKTISNYIVIDYATARVFGEDELYVFHHRKFLCRLITAHHSYLIIDPSCQVDFNLPFLTIPRLFIKYSDFFH